MIRLLRKPRAVPEPHKHVYDSQNAWYQFGLYTVLECKCGLGRVYSPYGITNVAVRRSNEPAIAR